AAAVIPIERAFGDGASGRVGEWAKLLLSPRRPVAPSPRREWRPVREIEVQVAVAVEVEDSAAGSHRFDHVAPPERPTVMPEVEPGRRRPLIEPDPRRAARPHLRRRAGRAGRRARATGAPPRRGSGAVLARDRGSSPAAGGEQ